MKTSRCYTNGMFAKYQQNTAGILTVVFVLGICMAFGSQIITSQTTTDSRTDSICSGPAEAGFTCPGTIGRITYKGFPWHFITDTTTTKVGGDIGQNTPTPVTATTLSGSGFLLDCLAYIAGLTVLAWAGTRISSRTAPKHS